MSTFAFNKLFILESLLPTELQTGTELEKRINSWAPAKGVVCQAVTFQVHTIQDWEIAWNAIYTSIEKMGNIPIIHLEMHGNKTAVGIDKGKNGVIPLMDVFEKVQRANILAQNNVFLSLAVCMGLNVIRSLKVYEPMPFCGVLGSLETLNNDELLENYTIFYKAFLATLNLDKAKQIMEGAGIDATKYELYKPEQIFMNAYLGYLEGYKTDEQILNKAIDAAQGAGIAFDNDESQERFVRDYRVSLLLTEGQEYKKAVDTFFMFDRYPTINSRFVVPHTIQAFKQLAGKDGNERLLEKRPLTFEDKKGLSIQILHEVDDFCVKNNIKYSLAYGTLIGAIRHKGFIPWDDDVDIMMLRSDYERFVGLFNHDATQMFSVASYETDDNFRFPMAKVSCNVTTNEELGLDRYGYAIDVFPIDKFPASENELRKVIKKKNWYWNLMALKTMKWNKTRSLGKNLIMSASKAFVNFIPYSLIHKMMRRDVYKYEQLQSNYLLGCLYTPYGERDIFPKGFFDTYIPVVYENCSFPVIKEYDKYLTSVYGDYMRLPPEEKRVTHHSFNAFWK